LLLVPSGYIADRFGRNLPMALGLLLFPVSAMILTLARSPFAAVIWASIAAAGYVLCLPALSASLLDLSSSGNRGLLTGVSTSIQAIGLVVGPLLGGLLIDGLGPLAPLRASSGVMAIAFALGLVYGARTRGLYRERVHQSIAAEDLRRGSPG
jgi:MFS family permease